MHSKKSLIRVLTRILYAGGFVLLITGLLLSALSTSAFAAGVPVLNSTQPPTAVTPPNCNCITPTPVRTHAPTATGTKATPRPTHPPLEFNLSSICGYTYDNYELWKVANNTDTDATFIWRVVDSKEMGSGKVPAHGSVYFTTSPGQKTVRLYVNDILMDSENCLAPCKKELQLSYTCTAQGLTWVATNSNSFGVDYTLKVDHQAAGKGTMKANSTMTIATTTSGAHTVELTWTDTRPGTHTVALSSPPNSCIVTTTTATPTFTETLPVETLTPTPTTTLTPQAGQIFTVTPTVTETRPVSTVTVTPTVTETVPVSTVTPTETATVTQTIPVSTVTVTPTTTLTPQSGQIFTVTPTETATVTQTAQISTVTVTPTVTQTPQVSTVTVTPTTTLTPLSGQILTVTPTPTTQVSTVTVTPTTTLTPLAGFVPTVTATHIVTLPAPAGTITSTPVLIPVTGVDLTRPIGANSLSLFGGLFTNIGLFTLGLALALTGITSQMKD